MLDTTSIINLMHCIHPVSIYYLSYPIPHTRHTRLKALTCGSQLATALGQCRATLLLLLVAAVLLLSVLAWCGVERVMVESATGATSRPLLCLQKLECMLRIRFGRVRC